MLEVVFNACCAAFSHPSARTRDRRGRAHVQDRLVHRGRVQVRPDATVLGHVPDAKDRARAHAHVREIRDIPGNTEETDRPADKTVDSMDKDSKGIQG
ncbi:hypothetical protein [Paenibacillus lautus]|uniref:hypothetical protein n=1 Tax=Paenibacillus lautus TaxID=1401 RepID=UPI001BD104B1|nr:hypothetical protein [Paenibacillus lautus]